MLIINSLKEDLISMLYILIGFIIGYIISKILKRREVKNKNGNI